jgi:hypothetical protein
MKTEHDNQTPVPLYTDGDANYKNVLLDLIASKGNVNEENQMAT